MMNYGHDDYRNRKDNIHNHRRRNSSSDNENMHDSEDKMHQNNILSTLSNMFQQQKNFPNSENEINNDESSRAMTLATLLTLPTSKLEETMNNELSTQQTHINSEYIYLFYCFKKVLCFSVKLLKTFERLKTLKKQKFSFLNNPNKEFKPFFSFLRK